MWNFYWVLLSVKTKSWMWLNRVWSCPSLGTQPHLGSPLQLSSFPWEYQSLPGLRTFSYSFPPFTSPRAQLTSHFPRAAFLSLPSLTLNAIPGHCSTLLCIVDSTNCTQRCFWMTICSLFMSPTVCEFHKNGHSALFTTLSSMLSKAPGAQEIISKQMNAQ